MDAELSQSAAANAPNAAPARDSTAMRDTVPTSLRGWQFLHTGSLTARLAGQNQSLSDALDVASQLRFGDDSARIESIAGELIRRGWTDATIRQMPPDAPIPEPLQVPIEPLALDEADEHFIQLASICGTTIADDNQPDAEALAQKKQRTWYFGLLAGTGYLLFQIISETIVSFRNGRPTMSLLVCSGLLLVVVLFQVRRRERRIRRFRLVNGGLLLRDEDWKSPAVKLHLFRRDTSVLFVMGDEKLDQRLRIFDAKHPLGIKFTASPAEAELLLRAWLSPLPPPEIERLSDFA